MKRVLGTAAVLLGLGAAMLPITGASAAFTCTPTNFYRDGINMTAAQIGGNVTGPLNAADTSDGIPCNIGVYYDNAHALGNVTGANIFGANYFGVMVNADVGAVNVNVTNSQVHDIGETPLNGTQHGNAIYYRALGTGTSSATISGNTLDNYQKGGITVNGAGISATIKNNAVNGEGRVPYIAQNGIQIGYGAKATVTNNNVSGHAYVADLLAVPPPGEASSAGILVVGGPCYSLPYSTGLTITKNTLTNNDIGVWLFNAVSTADPNHCVAGTDKTNNTVKFNTITNDAVTNTNGYNATCGYQAGVADVGHKDLIVNNTITGAGYTPVPDDCAGTPQAFVRRVDTDSSARAVPSNK